MTQLLCVGDKVLWRGAFGTEGPRVAVVVSIELCDEPHGKYGRRVPEVEWDLRERLNVTLDNSHWAYGDQLEPFVGPVEFTATVGRWPEGGRDRVFDALAAWAYEDEGFSRGPVLVDFLGDGREKPIRATAYSTVRSIRRERAWATEAEGRLRKRVEAVGGDDVRLEVRYL